MTHFIVSMLAALLGAFGVNGVTTAPARVDDALRRWEQFGERVKYEELLSCADAVRQMARKGDPEVLERLMAIVKDTSKTLPSRGQALTVACELADERGALLLVEMVEAQCVELMQARGNRDMKGRDQVLYSNGTLVQSFVRHEVEKLLDVMEDHTRLLAFLKDFYRMGYYSFETEAECARLIAECEAPLRARQAAVVEIIERWRKGAAREVLLDILDPSVFPQLRPLVRAETSPNKFNFAAADALSYLGDTEIVADFEALRPTFRAQSRHGEARLLNYIWRIEMQHPPTKLLEYIASTDRRGYRDYRYWAIRRAYKLGVDPARIREAILAHANAAAPTDGRRGLGALKQAGLELDILKDTDLPEVKVHNGTTVTP